MKGTGKTAQADASVRCAQVHRETARTLRAMFKDGSSSQKDGRMRVALHLNRMARAAGIDPTTYEIKARWLLYLRAARALSRAGQSADSAYAKQVQVAVIQTLGTIERRRKWEQEREQERERAQTQSAPVNTQTIKLPNSDERGCYRFLGLQAGDQVEVTAAPVCDLRGGDLIGMWHLKQKSWYLVRFICAEQNALWDEHTGERANTLTIETLDDTVICKQAKYLLYRAQTIVRRIKVERGTTPELEATRREARLRQLRARLEKLDHEDDQIIRCTQRFQLEKQIYDLEHAPDTEEWPEVIGGGA
jgi:hypothetical protein